MRRRQPGAAQQRNEELGHRWREASMEVRLWAPTRLTSCIFHPGHTEAYEPLRSTRRPARAPFSDLVRDWRALVHDMPRCRPSLAVATFLCCRAVGRAAAAQPASCVPVAAAQPPRLPLRRGAVAKPTNVLR